MGETREPMARDCVQDALKIANLYEHLDVDFWVCFAAKPHTQHSTAIVCGWEVIFNKPAKAIPGVLIWHVDHKTKSMTLDTSLSLPYDIPLDERELSESSKDVTPTLGKAAEQSGAVLLA